MKKVLFFSILLMFLLPACSSKPPVHFFKEKLKFTIRENSVLVEGDYSFKNLTSVAKTVNFFYPFVIDTNQLYPDTIQLDIPHANAGSGITFALTVKPFTENGFTIRFNQPIKNKYYKYITTTTRIWKRPIELAVFKITAPDTVDVRINYAGFNSGIRNGIHEYEAAFDDFFPNEDLFFEWGELKTETAMPVVTSILPLAEFVKKIGGDRVSVTVMVGPGASPHTYEPTPQQLREVSEAKVYVKLGAPIEFELTMLDKLLALNSKMTVIDAGAGVAQRSMNEHEHDDQEHGIGTDPHIWLSVRNARIMVNNIYNKLCFIDPDSKDYYTDNFFAYANALDSLDHELNSIISNKKNRRFMVYHPSWGYFCADYGLTQIAVEIEGKEPSARDLRKLIELAKREKIKIIFASPQFSVKGAEVIARDIGGHVIMVDPLARDYIDNIKKISRAFAASME